MRRPGWIRLSVVGCLFVLCLTGQVFGEGPLSGYLDRSYYTTEAEAVVVCSVALPEEVLGGSVLTVKDAKGSVLGRNDAVSAETRIALKVGTLPVGRHDLKLELRKDADGAVTTSDLILVKKAPKPGCEVKVDKINRVILRNGEPFFPHGLIMTGSEQDYKAAAEIGFNTLWTRGGGAKPARAAEFADRGARYGLMTVLNVSNFCRGFKLDALKDMVSAEGLEKAQNTLKYEGRSAKKFTYGLSHSNVPALKKLPDEAKIRLTEEYCEKNKPALTETITLSKESPNLLAYYIFDEPASSLGFLLGSRFYRLVQEVDGYHPSLPIYSSHVPEGDQWVDWMDCLGTDPYWVPGAKATHGTRGTVNYVSKITYLTRKRADERQQVTWSVPTAEYWSGIRKRGVMPREQFCQTYLAVIHGAKAITYFRWPFKTQETRKAHTALCEQMKLIGPIAVTPDIPQVVKYDPGKFDPENDEFPDIQVSLRRNPAGGYVLLAANSRYYPVDATYRISLLTDGAKVKRLFDEKKYDVQEGAFSDHVEFMGTRAYAFESDVPLNGPVEISVEMKAQPDQTDPVYGAPGHPDTGRPGKRNLMRNPGFEEAGLPGWPDYYLLNPPGPRAGRPGSEYGYGLDTENPYEGKACLWVHAKAGSSPNSTLFYGACSPKLTEETPFVLSAYMRANRDGVKVRFKGFGWRVPKATFGYKEFTLTTKWQRYSEQGTLIPGLPTWHSLGVEILALDKDVTVFYDAIQFEEGEEVTEYEP